MRITDLKGTVELANGTRMPYLGLGVFQTPNNEIKNAVHAALDFGYRHIDTAAFYENEDGLGEAIKSHSISRKEIFITSKVWNTDQGYDETIRAFGESLKKLQTDYLDLYLVHWPIKGKYTDTWRALETLYEEGRIRAIGVSNFLQHHLEDVMATGKIVPMVNQMEFHPHLVQQDLIDFCKKHSIQYEAWSPLMQGGIFEIDLLKDLSEKYSKSIAQIVLRWDLQKGVVTIPKSVKKNRIEENASIFDFEISEEDMKKIDALDCNERIGPHPDKI
ncbi:aldo/keto reductase [Marinilabilia salmonicolor]|jgi:diketogulonate reductase-like aldo/keto reductase|uniref:Diketogulonate reductase-like aldo/keto reductase n=1 Tax=Marinilabilia salmonicolor TaxID=989 RepID=A0A2T0XPJ8_9BACT|nr:aldo/keto reductase [Marinilabilia salmonicolor]PRZ00885.1 diketogulonate reductase-like aldo/keto reductase [Marinilabilia salmonicolor]RCW30380.1 diketogulonate reductase-like aldo/keto reductase [Marinilabilia salmonicolor]